MSIELEVKVLNIDIKAEQNKILKKGGEYVCDVAQKLYTYDLPSIYGRFLEIISYLDKSNKDVEKTVNYVKLKNLFFELDNLEPFPDLSFLAENNIIHFSDILKCSDWKQLLHSKEFIDFLKKYGINNQKWVRLRQTNNKTTLAVKHILSDATSAIQQLSETEIEVSSFEETDMLLQQLGFVFKSYQEKKRSIFMLRGHEIDFEFWPGIPPYMEFEGNSEEELVEILQLLEYSIHDTVSCTADAVYKMYGKDMLEFRTLTF